MACIVKILLLSWLLGLTLASPICDKNCLDKATVTENKKSVRDINDNHLNTSEDCSQDDASNCSSSSEEDAPQDPFEILKQVAREYKLQHYHPKILTSLPQGYSDAYNFGSVGNCKRPFYPYEHPKLLAAYNSEYNVNALPPVVSTYIHGLIPREEMQRAAYNLDVLMPEELGYLPAVSRPSRMLRASDEDWLAQLQHDAIMSNILPTMQVPFARYAAPAAYGPAGSVSAVFPNAAAGGCAQPILFSCTPRIIQGTLRPVGSYQPAAAYRQHDEVTKKVDETHSAPVKLDLAGKTVPSTNVKEN